VVVVPGNATTLTAPEPNSAVPRRVTVLTGVSRTSAMRRHDARPST